MKSFARWMVMLLAATLVACGSTGDIRPSPSAGAVGPQGPVTHASTTSLSTYDRVAVLDFVDATDKSKIAPDQLALYTNRMADAVKTFPEEIAQQLRATGAFSEVLRGPVTGRALVVSGRITRLVEGNASLRLWIGLGAGSSYFEATTELADSESGQPLGQLLTDKNSWALGGIIASSQTVESFMQGAAKAIGEKIKAGKLGHQVASAK